MMCTPEFNLRNFLYKKSTTSITMTQPTEGNKKASCSLDHMNVVTHFVLIVF